MRVGVRAGEVACRVAEQLEHAGRGFLKRYGAVRLVAAVQIAGNPALLHGGLDVAGRPVGVGNVLERGRVGRAGNLILIGRGADEHFRVFRAGDGAAEVHVAAAVADHDLSGPDRTVSAILAAFGGSVFNLAITTILYPPNYSTLPVYISDSYNDLKFGYAAAATMVGAAFIISIMMILEYGLNFRRNKGKIHGDNT